MVGQRTLKESIVAKGIGLHSGEEVCLVLRPAPVNTGVVFVRTDLDPVVTIPAKAEYVRETTLSTTLIVDDVRVGTIEHLMSAVAGMGIDNLIIDIDGPEVPIMDGSAAPFLYLLSLAGIAEQGAPKQFLKITKPIEVVDGDKRAVLKPFDGYRIDFKIEFDHPAIADSANQVAIDFAKNSYMDAVGRARTFGFMRDIEYLQANNLAKGGSLDNAIVLDDYSILNADGLRYEDEFVRHKILDAVGDLHLVGHNIIGELVAIKSGHALNNQLARAVLSAPDSWGLVTFDPSASPWTALEPSLV